MSAERPPPALSAAPASAVLTTSPDGTITSRSPGAQRLYGWTAQEAVGRPLLVIVPEDRRAELAQLEQRRCARSAWTRRRASPGRRRCRPTRWRRGWPPARPGGALHGKGASLHTIAAALNAAGRRTPNGPRRTNRCVARVIAARAAPG